jgi:hypothetical protein
LKPSQLTKVFQSVVDASNQTAITAIFRAE